MNRIILFSLFLIGAVACSRKAPKSVVQKTPEPAAAIMEVPAPQMAGSKILVSKGTIRSAYEVKVFSTIEGQLLEVNLIEGQMVRKGELMFNLDASDIEARIALSESEYEQAKLRMDEILIGQGYKREALNKAPAQIREYAGIKSGVNIAKRELELNRSILKRCRISAPQTGLITGINALSYDFVKPGQTLCTIVDPTHLIVEFSILETELRKFKIGTQIEVRSIAYADIPHFATVRSIGSVVDEGGMVRVEASISDPKDLIPGMTAIINL